jgi:glycosyltransferase involved in cell wall biosynthesis
MPDETSSTGASINLDAGIAVITYKRPALLSLCLASVALQRNPLGSMEVLVIDDCPQGSAETVVQEVAPQFEAHGIPLRYVQQGGQGLASARNRAVAEIECDIICFMDDDQRACPNWLSNPMLPFQSLGDLVDIVAGENEPDFGEAARPEWLDDEHLKLYSCGARWDVEPRFMQPGEWLFEGNCAVRRKILQGLSFDPALGRSGSNLISNEGVIYDIARHRGASAYYMPKAQVHHRIHSERLNKRWLLKRNFYQGVSDFLVDRMLGRQRRVSEITVDFARIKHKDVDKLDAIAFKRYCAGYYVAGYCLASNMY